MKSIICVLVLLLSPYSYSQTFQSNSLSKQKTEFEVSTDKRTVEISDNNITVSNLLNGGNDSLILEVIKTELKDYSWEGLSKWYYCKNGKGVNYTAIVINSKNPRSLVLFQEVLNGASSIQTKIDLSHKVTD